MSRPSIPALGGGLAAVAVALSVLSLLSDDAQNGLVLKPGNTVLGQYHVWTVATYAFVERNIIKLAVSVGLIVLLSWAVERNPLVDAQSVRAVQLRAAAAATFGAATAGVTIAFSFLMLYTSSGDEAYLYRSVYGTGPVAAALAVCVHQIAGNAPALPSFAPWLPASALPAAVLILEAVAQYGLKVSRCFLPSAISLLAAWTYLRWFHTFAPGCVGDARADFEFLSMLPSPIQLPLRPLVNLFSALLLRLPCFTRASGDGLSLLPRAGQPQQHATPPAAGALGAGGAAWGPGSPGGPSSVAPAPPAVVERRMEKALVALERRLAEMRSQMGGSPAGKLHVPGAAAGAAGAKSPVPQSAAAPTTPAPTPAIAAAVPEAAGAAAAASAAAAAPAAAEATPATATALEDGRSSSQ